MGIVPIGVRIPIGEVIGARIGLIRPPFMGRVDVILVDIGGIAN